MGNNTAVPNTCAVRNEFAPRCAEGATLEYASHAGALVACSHAAGRERAKHGFARQKRERGSRTLKGKSAAVPNNHRARAISSSIIWTKLSNG